MLAWRDGCGFSGQAWLAGSGKLIAEAGNQLAEILAKLEAGWLSANGGLQRLARPAVANGGAD